MIEQSKKTTEWEIESPGYWQKTVARGRKPPIYCWIRKEEYWHDDFVAWLVHGAIKPSRSIIWLGAFKSAEAAMKKIDSLNFDVWRKINK